MQVNNFACVIWISLTKKRDGDIVDKCVGAGSGQEVGEDAGDRPQPTQVGAEDEVGRLFFWILFGFLLLIYC